MAAGQVDPGAGQSAATRHCTQLPLKHLAVEFWQTWHVEPQWAGDELMSTHIPSHRPCPDAQLVAQVGVPSVRHPNMHVIMVAAVHAPAPLHSAAVTALPAVQLAAAPHEVVVPGKTHDLRLAGSKEKPARKIRNRQPKTFLNRDLTPLESWHRHTANEP